MLRRCRGPGSLQRAQEDIHDLARFEAEARAMRAALQRMSLMGTVLSGGAITNGGGGLDGTTTLEDTQHLENRREFLDNALLTKVCSLRIGIFPIFFFFLPLVEIALLFQ